jgi:hypothetical protein
MLPCSNLPYDAGSAPRNDKRLFDPEDELHRPIPLSRCAPPSHRDSLLVVPAAVGEVGTQAENLHSVIWTIGLQIMPVAQSDARLGPSPRPTAVCICNE